jgi:hypothetical protein
VPLKREAKNLLRASACRRGVRARTVTQSSTPPTTLLDGVAGQIAAIAEHGDRSDGRSFMDTSGVVEGGHGLREAADEEYAYLSIHRSRHAWEGPPRDALDNEAPALPLRQRFLNGRRLWTAT